jgi:steroid 5-alpha reductase family enzyme
VTPSFWPEPLPFDLLTFLGVALVISAFGFARVVYFVSLGYAFSVAAIAGLSMWLLRDTATPLALVHCAGIILYGLRLGGFLLRREISASFAREQEEVQKRGAGIPLFVMFLIWISVGLLYVVMATPAVYAMLAPAPVGGLLASQVLGLALLFGGLALESIADRQKSAYKVRHPKHYCDEKLYRWVRCPNYFGEMVIWVGVFVAGIHAYSHWLHWLTASIGFVCIQLIMVGSARRLERIQGERYGKRKDYKKFVREVPILFPWVKVYSLQKWKIYLG